MPIPENIAKNILDVYGIDCADKEGESHEDYKKRVVGLIESLPHGQQAAVKQTMQLYVYLGHPMIPVTWPSPPAIS